MEGGADSAEHALLKEQAAISRNSGQVPFCQPPPSQLLYFGVYVSTCKCVIAFVFLPNNLQIYSHTSSQHFNLLLQ